MRMALWEVMGGLDWQVIAKLAFTSPARLRLG